jgi:hypothetical protein
MLYYWSPNKTFDIEVPPLAIQNSEFPRRVNSEDPTEIMTLCEVCWWNEFITILFNKFIFSYS